MEWWEFATLIFAALSFLGMCWQIVRAESLAPTPTLHIEWDDPTKESDKTVQVTLRIRPAFGFDFYGVKVLEATDWPYRRECWLKRDERKVTEDAPLFHRLRYPVGGSGSFVIQVLSVSPIRKRLIACAWKVTAADAGADLSGPKQRRLLTETRSWRGASWMVESSSRLEDSIRVLAGREGLVSSGIAAVRNPSFLIGSSILIRMLPTQQARTKMDTD